MKKLLFILFVLMGYIVQAQQPVDTYTVRGRYEVQSDRAFIIGRDPDTLKASTQTSVIDTTIVTLLYAGNNFVKNPTDSILFNVNAIFTGHTAYKVDIDTANGAMRFYNDETEIAMQIGQELWIKIKNNNGDIFLNGILVYISGGETGFPIVSIAHNRDFETVDAIGMLTHDVESGTFGFLTTFGTVGSLDTSGETEGMSVYVDTLTAGKNWTTTIPEFARFQYEIGFIHTVDNDSGKIFINVKGQLDDIMHNINNANILENFNFTSFSDGSDIYGILNSSDGKDYLTVRWSDGFAKISVPDTIIIPPGLDNNSQTAYFYIPKSTGNLTSSTSYFPIGTQYKTIARTAAWTPLRTQTEGLKGNQNYNDFVANIESLRGRIAQIGNWQRLRNLKYINGSAGTITIRPDGAGADTVSFAVAQGNWSQANEQVLEAMDMYTGDIIHVLNYPDHADTTISDLSEVLIDATGSSLANRSWTWVFWISQNKTGEPSHMYVNLPNGSYSSGSAASSDALGYKVTDIPYELRPYSGFVLEVVMTHTNPGGGTWTVFVTADIRGNDPGYQGGSAGVGVIGNFDDLGDTPSTKAGSSNKVVGVDLGEVNLEYKDVTIDGSGNIDITGTGTVNTITNSIGDFLTASTNGGLITQRTAAEVLSDIGAVAISPTPFATQLASWVDGVSIQGIPVTWSSSTLDVNGTLAISRTAPTFLLDASSNDDYQIDLTSNSFGIKNVTSGNYMLNFYTDGSAYFSDYGDGTHTGTPAYGAAWAANGKLIETAIGTISSIAAGDGMDFTTITTGIDTITMGQPNTLHSTTINEATGTTHTHSITFGSWDLQDLGDTPIGVANQILQRNAGNTAYVSVPMPSGTSKWQSLSGAIAPVTISNEVRIGTVSDLGTEIFQISGEQRTETNTASTYAGIFKNTHATGRGLYIQGGGGVDPSLYVTDYTAGTGLLVLSVTDGLNLGAYGSGTYTGTDAKWLAVTSSGDIIEEDPPSSISLGTDNQIPSVNAGGTDFEYSSNFTWSGTSFDITGSIKASNGLYSDALWSLTDDVQVATPDQYGMIFNRNIRLAGQAGDISPVTNGDIWYDSNAGKFRVYEDGVAYDMLDGGGGTVTSIDIVSSDFTSSGGPITSSGDITLNLDDDAIANQTELASGLVSTDELLVSDNDVLKRMDISIIETYMRDSLTVKIRQSLTSSGSIAMDFDDGSKSSFTIGHDATLTISNIPDGEDGIITVTQDVATARTLSIQGGTGYTTEIIFGANAVIDATLSNQTKIVYERVNDELHISFIYEN